MGLHQLSTICVPYTFSDLMLLCLTSFAIIRNRSAVINRYVFLDNFNLESIIYFVYQNINMMKFDSIRKTTIM